ncbi:hypothetical protein VULLAG_LOCUS14534 [Vulpes lagopus]
MKISIRKSFFPGIVLRAQQIEGIYRGEIVQEIVFPDALFSDLMLEKLSSEVNMETHCTSDVNNCYHQKIAQPH